METKTGHLAGSQLPLFDKPWCQKTQHFPAQ